MSSEPLNVLCFGAHPDDCDLRFGGAAMFYRELGHRVKLVSMTNGDTGHFSMGGGPLARRRNEEAQAAGAIADVEYQVLDIHNGELEPSVANRKLVIQLMREFQADLVLCHRPCDYHPDHRAVGVLVQDAAYTVTVPNVAALTPHLRRPPVVGYLNDSFQIPNPYLPQIAIDTDPVFDRKVEMVHQHVSQFYEWLPYNRGGLDDVPDGEDSRRAWLHGQLAERFGKVAEEARDSLVRLYGEDRGLSVRTAETVMVSEYGRALTDSEVGRYFPMLDTPPDRSHPAPTSSRFDALALAQDSESSDEEDS